MTRRGGAFMANGFKMLLGSQGGVLVSVVLALPVRYPLRHDKKIRQKKPDRKHHKKISTDRKVG